MADMRIVDLDPSVEMPLCPLCDNPVSHNAVIGRVKLHGDYYFGLVHGLCAEPQEEE